MKKNRAAFILCFLHDDIRHFAGGLAKYVREEAALAAERGIDLVTVFPLRIRQCPGLAAWSSRGWGVCRGLCWLGMHGWKGLVSLVGNWEREGSPLTEIQLHHVGHFALADLCDFLAGVPAPVRLFLHDYHTVCGSAHLMRNGRVHCGTSSPCEGKCRGCDHWRPGWLPGMKSFLGMLGDRLHITAPSRSAAEGWLETWPEFRNRIEVVPHWLPVRTVRGSNREAPGARLRVAFAGAQLPHKGWDAWTRAVATARAAGIPADFLYFGLDPDVPDGVRAVRTGDGQMADALRNERVDILCLWSVWPETYSYVYHEAVLSGTWVVAPEVSGNVADSIRTGGWGTLLRDDAELAAFLCDERRMRAVLAGAREMARPVEMVPNPRILDELPPPRPLGLRGGFVGRSLLHEIVWHLKQRTGHA